MPQSKEQEMVALERAFWDTMKTKDGQKAASMTADKCVVVGAQGVGTIDGAMMGQMMSDGKWSLESYSFDDKSLQAHFVTDDVAIVAYKVTENLTVEGAPVSFDANDASVWVRKDGSWKCVLHTESVAGDPYGRDKVKKV